jgi:hypothetical protein
MWVDGDQDHDDGGERDQREAALEEERLVLVEPEIEPDERAERGRGRRRRAVTVLTRPAQRGICPGTHTKASAAPKSSPATLVSVP